MKYKLLKETPWVADGAIIEVDDTDVDKDVTITNDSFELYRDGKDYSSETYDWMRWHIQNHPEDFEEVKEALNPRWKVGDKIVRLYSDYSPDYLYLYRVTLHSSEKSWIYNDGLEEEDLREPTPDELSLYFK